MRNHKAVALTSVVAVAVFAALVGSPLLLLFIVAAIAFMAMLLRRGDQPIVANPTSTTRWYRWVVAGVASFAVGVVVLVIDGPELSSPGWATWMLSWAMGLVLVLFGFVLLSSRLLHRHT
jgi:hypothetical protein